MTKTPPPNEIEERFRACEQEYDRIKTCIRDVDFICEGSLFERWMSCGKPNCSCGADPPRLHGPYHQLTYKKRGKTVCRRLPPEHARFYKEWIANRRQLDSLLKQMRAVSQKAGKYLLDAATEAAQASGKPPQSRRSRKPKGR